MIDNVRVFPLQKKAGSIVANLQFKVGDLICSAKLLDGKNGKFIQMPQRVSEKDGKKIYHDEVYLLTKESKAELLEKTLAEYNKDSSLDQTSQDSGPDNQNIPFG